MKKILFLISVMLIFINVQSQQATPEKPLTVERETLKAINNTSTSLFFYVAGVYFITTAESLDISGVSYKKYMGTRQGNYIAGGTFILGGLFFDCLATIHFLKASDLLDKKELTIKASPMGIGLCLKF